MDQRGNLRAIDYPDGTSERWEYNDRGLATVWTDRRNNRTTYGYDEYGYLKSVTDPGGRPERRDDNLHL